MNREFRIIGVMCGKIANGRPYSKWTKMLKYILRKCFTRIMKTKQKIYNGYHLCLQPLGSRPFPSVVLPVVDSELTWSGFTWLQDEHNTMLVTVKLGLSEDDDACRGGAWLELYSGYYFQFNLPLPCLKFMNMIINSIRTHQKYILHYKDQWV